MTNEELVSEIQSGKNVPDNMLQLWQQNQGIIHRVANRYQYHEDMDDILQQSFLGLHQVAVNYRPQENVSFVTYLAFTLRWCINKYCRENEAVRLPVKRLNGVFRYLKLQQEFLVSFGREPTDSEIEGLLGISDSAVQCLKRDAAMRQTVSLDTPISGMEDEEISLLDLTPDKKADTESAAIDSISRKRLYSALNEALDELPEKQSFVIKSRFIGGQTLEKIGERLGCTGNQARAIQENGLRTLRRNSELRKLTDCEIFSRGIKGCGVEHFKNTWESSTEKTAFEICKEMR